MSRWCTRRSLQPTTAEWYDCNGNLHAKQKHLGCKKVRGQSETTCKQAKALISAEAKKLATLSKKLLTP